MWFEVAAEDTIQLFMGPDSLKVRRLRRDPRASIVVAPESLLAEMLRRYFRRPGGCPWPTFP
ncbi:hypothetical protein AB0G83_17595 [Streptomyces klenkii]|uniref:hypothetical protein n=1 Tax=Streptomyces klenkii TaxID=1420899 RepID=UPI0033F8B0DB